MTKLLLVIALGVLVTTQAGATDGTIDEFIDREMPVSGVPGLSYAGVDGAELTSSGVRGEAKKDSGTAVTADTPFLIGSITKSFTALAVMQLVEDGQIELDSSLSTYLDEFAGQPGGKATIRQLLSHASGYSTIQGNTSHVVAAEGPDELELSVRALAEVTPAYEPGERWDYSNANYQILGRVIEVVSGESYQSYVEENIIEPVGMSNSFVADGEVHDEMATGHTPWFGSKRPNATNDTDLTTAPQGGVIATATDLGLYMQTMMNGEDDVLSAEGKAQMLTSRSDLSPFYGFGWFLDPEQGIAWHDGTSVGVETLAAMIPAERKGAVVLVNGGSGMGFGETSDLRNGITALTLGLPFEEADSPLSRQILFISLALLPVFYLISMWWAWRKRDVIRAKSGPSGQFSLWFPLFTTLAAAWVILWLVPVLFGAPMSTIRLFSPDLGLVFITGALFGVLWAVWRLVVAYTGRRSSG